jgi:hypothetical protein
VPHGVSTSGIVPIGQGVVAMNLEMMPRSTKFTSVELDEFLPKRRNDGPKLNILILKLPTTLP